MLIKPNSARQGLPVVCLIDDLDNVRSVPGCRVRSRRPLSEAFASADISVNISVNINTTIRPNSPGGASGAAV